VCGLAHSLALAVNAHTVANLIWTWRDIFICIVSRRAGELAAAGRQGRARECGPAKQKQLSRGS